MLISLQRRNFLVLYYFYMKTTVKHGIFLVSLFASIGMMLFSHYAYAAYDRPFGSRLKYEYRPPFFCQSQYGPLLHTPTGNSFEPSGLGEYGPSSEHVTGSIKPDVQILGLYSPTPSQNCYMQIGPYRYTVETTIFTYFGTSRL